MPLVTVSHVSRSFDGNDVLDDVTVELDKGRKIGVIGHNGSGKSTLLKLIAGEIEPSAGDVFRQRGVTLAYQAQELDVSADVTVLEMMQAMFGDVAAGERRLREVEHRLAGEGDVGEQRRLLREYGRLQDAHAAAGGYDVEQRIETVLTGLGLPRAAWEQPVADFSGGERNVIGLARILISNPDVLLLDEPSNHLDMDGLEWFIRFIRQSSATVLMVSHNRHLLDATVGEIWEVGRGHVARWAGNYSDYQRQKAEARALQERQYRNQQRTIKRLEFQARRLRDMARAYDDPGQAKRAKAMLKRIEQMEVVDRPDAGQRTFGGTLRGASRHGHMALEVKDFSFAYGDRVLFDRADLEITYGQRVCLFGPNGCGKTTLFRAILGEGSWDAETIRVGKSVRLGDYNQFHEEAMDPRSTLLEWIMETTDLLAQPASELLHRFLFARDDLDRPIGTLSGGEKSRLQIARLVQNRVNFLMLDEPTNHLDIPSCEQLETMLEEFDGTLLVISHDRYFLDRLVDTVVEVRDRKLRVYHGDFASWWERRCEAKRLVGEEPTRPGVLTLHGRSGAAAAAATTPSDKAARRQEREDRKARQREERRLKNRIAALEKEIAAAEEAIPDIERRLEEAYSSEDGLAEGARLTRELEETREKLEGMYAEWEETGAKLEKLEG